MTCGTSLNQLNILKLGELTNQHFYQLVIQWNLDLTILYITKFSV